MRRSFWLAVLVLLLAGPAPAQSLTGVWQGVETDTGQPDGNWPSVLRLQQGAGANLFGVLYQEVGEQPAVTVTFQVQAARTGNILRLEHTRKLNETGRTPFSHWCEGAITFTYDPKLEKLTGQATYRPVGDCDYGTFALYRIKLKSAGTVPAGTETTIRVSGRNVLWFADAQLKQPVNSGNTFRTKLSSTTTFYLTQSFYPTRQNAVVPITIRVAEPVAARGSAPVAPLFPTRPDTLLLPTELLPEPAVGVAPLLPSAAEAAPVVLPTVLFKLATPELMPESRPALQRLAAELQARPGLKLRIAGHTDKIGEPQKNQQLSEQRAAAVKTYLVQAGVAAERLSTVGYGDTRPLYPSPDARNRRVEVQPVQ